MSNQRYDTATFIKFLKTFHFKIGSEALEIEQSLLEQFSDYRVTNLNFKDTFGGHTEFFNYNIFKGEGWDQE